MTKSELINGIIFGTVVVLAIIGLAFGSEIKGAYMRRMHPCTGYANVVLAKQCPAWCTFVPPPQTNEDILLFGRCE